jgi:biotin transport system substrate-specific component
MQLKPLTIRPGSLAVNLSLPRSCKAVLAGTLGVVGFAGLTWVGSQIRIPIGPVPITLQTLFVLLAGALVGSFRGWLSQTLYVTAGSFGLPVFAGTVGGLAVLSGPTGGYIVGFVVAPLVVGKLISARKGFAWSVFVFTLGSLLILALGVLHLAFFYTPNLWTAIQVGLLPFLAGDAAKIFAAASIYSSYRRFRSNRR